MKKNIICFWLICCSTMAAGQQMSNIFFEWNKENSNYPGYSLIENFSQEKNGILWLGGREGLLRFDGQHFQPFTSQVFDSTTIPGNYIAAQYIDGNYLYGGTFSTGFFVMDLTSLKAKRITLLGPQIGNKFSATAITSNGKDSLWIACSRKQLICVSKNKLQQRPHFKLTAMQGNIVDSGTIFNIEKTKHDASKLWALTAESILLINGSTGSYASYRFLVNNKNGQSILLDKPTSIVEETDSTALVSFFRSGLLKWNFKNNSYQHFEYPITTAGVTNRAINKIMAISPGEYFVSTSNSGLYIFNSVYNNFRKIVTKNNLFSNLISEPTRELFQDKNGGIWISMNGGISYWHPAYQGVEAYSTQPALKNTVASSVQHYENQILVSRRDREFPLSAFNTQNKQWEPAPANSLKDDYVRRKLAFNGGYIYNTINGEWVSYDNATQQMQNFQLPEPLSAIGKKINGIDESELYIATSSMGGVYTFDKKNKIFQFHTSSYTPDSLHVKNTMEVKLDRHHQAWFGSVFGLSLYNFQTKKFLELSFRTNREWQGLRVISDFQLDKNDLMYVATQDDGVYVFDTKTNALKAHYNKDYLLNENFVNSIILDSSQNYLWATTVSGVNVIDLRQQQAKRWDKQNSGLDVVDGFFGMTVLNNNEVYCSDSVLYYFKMGSFDKIDVKPFISGYIADKKYFNGGNLINVDKDINYIELFISTGFFADAIHGEIQYRLNNKAEWNDVEKGKIIIPSLKNGETTIQLRALLQGVLHGDGESSITIKRGLYFYQTLWFKALVLLLLIGLIYLIFNIRIQQVRKQEQEKGLLQGKINELEIASLRSQMNPHFIFNTLSSLRYLVLKGDNKTASSFILKLSRLLRMILTNSSESLISLQDELHALKLYLEIEALRFDNEFSFSITINEGVETFDIKIPPMLLQPFVENAIKHGLVNSSQDEKWVNVSVSMVEEHSIKIAITDNGIGRNNASLLNKNSQHSSLGTQITNQRVELFNKTETASLHCTINDYCNSISHPGTIVEILYNHSSLPL